MVRPLSAFVLVALAGAGVALSGLVMSIKAAGETSPASCASATAAAATTSTAAASPQATVSTTESSPAQSSANTPAGTAGCGPSVTTGQPAATGVGPGAAAGPGTLVLTGHGYGHGVGMGQWGAEGYAQHGWSAAQILQHYYPGTTLEHGPSPTVDVLVSGPESAVTLGSTARWRVWDGRGRPVSLPAGERTVTTDLSIGGRKLVSPLTVSPAGPSPVEVDNRPYKGELLVESNGSTLDVVNEVGMESYLEGVVAEEMPPSWSPAALEAQAVAARSFALSELTDVVTVAPFDLYGDPRNQAYGGVDAEYPAVTAAVRATAGQVLYYRGQVAETLYSASSGGETVSAAEAFGTPIPYLVSVPDPYDVVSPYHDWGPVVLSADAAGAALGLQGPLLALQTVTGPSQHVETATAVGATRRLTLTGTQVAADLNLRSTWFDVGWLSLDQPASAVPYGTPATVGGVASGLSGVKLEAQLQGGPWHPVADVTPTASGSFAVAVRTEQTTSYRLAAGAANSAAISVTVAPAVIAAASPTAVAGQIDPAVAGEQVSLQREFGTAWTTVASAATTSGGDFAFVRTIAPGTYRVRCAGSGGLAPGFSAPLVQNQ